MISNQSRLFLFVATLLLYINTTFAQNKTYNFPNNVDLENIRISFKKVSFSSSSYYINYKAENQGSGVLVIDRKLTALVQNEMEFYPASDQYVLKSGENKTIFNQFRIKSSAQGNANILELKMNGMSYAKPSTALPAERLSLEEKATQTIGQFIVKVQELNVYSDRVFVELKCSFNGNMNSLGNIDLNKLIVSGGKAEVVKKGDVVFSGKSYTFAINITPNGEELSVDFNNVFQVMKLEKVALEPMVIKSTDYVAPKEDKKEEKEEIEEEQNITELSYSDFVALRKDIELELNNGGKPVEMAYEFLLEKKNISTSQILDLLDVFNLDGQRLAFAKMAYPFTSDKNRYHKAVGKMSYTKNKQALEEFLEQQ